MTSAAATTSSSARTWRLTKLTEAYQLRHQGAPQHGKWDVSLPEGCLFFGGSLRRPVAPQQPPCNLSLLRRAAHRLRALRAQGCLQRDPERLARGGHLCGRGLNGGVAAAALAVGR